MAQTSRASPIGVFHAVAAKSFPMVTKPFSAWMQVTQGNGHVRMKLVIERLLPDEPEFEIVLVTPFALHFADPNGIREHVIHFGHGVALPYEGSYQASLTAGGVTIMRRPFIAAAE